jgi:hypothetical protein
MKNSHCRDAKMEAYCDEVRRLEDKFYGLELNHIARRYNETADELAKIASGRTTVPPDVFSRDLHQPSIKTDDTPKPEAPSARPEAPSAPEGEALRVKEEQSGVTPYRNWQTPYLQYLHRGELPLDRVEARRLAWRQVVCLAGGREGALPPQPLRHPPAMHIHRRRPGDLTRNTLGGLRSSRSAPSPCWKRLPIRFLLANRGGRLGASAATRRPRAAQAHASLGRAVRHRQGSEVQDIQAGKQSRRGLQQRLEHPTATSLLPLRCFQVVHTPRSRMKSNHQGRVSLASAKPDPPSRARRGEPPLHQNFPRKRSFLPERLSCFSTTSKVGS